MFPINYNDPYTNNDGSVVPIGDIIGGGGGGSDIPPHTAEDAGKVLAVDDTGGLVWSEISAGVNQFERTATNRGYNNIVVNAKGGVTNAN